LKATDDYRLGALSGAAGGCGLFTEDYLLGALSGAARGFGRSQEIVKPDSQQRAAPPAVPSR